MKYIDVHSHILPHLDDGSQDMDTTLDMLRIAHREGIGHIIATPHYKSGRFPADSRRLVTTLKKVQQAADEEGIPIKLYPGNEIYYRSELEDKLQNGDLWTMNGSEYVLVEFSPFENFTYIRNAMEDILSMGYSPILAHVERYQCMCKKPDSVKELKGMGCDIQVNASSVTGDNGWMVKGVVHKLLKKGLVDYIGTDAHNASGRKPAMKKCAELLYKKYEASYVDALLFGNAQERFLDDEDDM